jgi:uncharacterized protein (UPF0264 family)
MDLLVSVRTAEEAVAASAGGAAIIDAKDPDSGALGVVTPAVFRAIRAAAPAGSRLTAALGDASDEIAIERDARVYAAAGAWLVKVGFAGIATPTRAASLLRAAVHGARAGDSASGVVAVAYADAKAGSIPPEALLDAAISVGAHGVLLDTCDKHGPPLRHLIEFEALHAWAASAHRCGLLVAMAGRLALADLPWVRDAGADVAGVRGAACDGGRSGHVSARRVADLNAALVELPI